MVFPIFGTARISPVGRPHRYLSAGRTERSARHRHRLPTAVPDSCRGAPHSLPYRPGRGSGPSLRSLHRTGTEHRRTAGRAAGNARSGNVHENLGSASGTNYTSVRKRNAAAQAARRFHGATRVQIKISRGGHAFQNTASSSSSSASSEAEALLNSLSANSSARPVICLRRSNSSLSMPT